MPQLRRSLLAAAERQAHAARAGEAAKHHTARRPFARPALALGGAIVAAGVLVAISLIGIGSDASRAFAGWTATPTAPVGNQTWDAEEACRSRLPTSAGIEHAQRTASGPHPHLPWPIPRIPAGGWRTVLADTRGPYTEILFTAAGGSAELSCFSSSSHRPVSLGGSFGIHAPAPVAAGAVTVVSSGSTTTPPDEGSRHFSQLVGRTGPGVDAVTVKLAGGLRVAATCERGWFLAWWPGSRGLRAIEPHT
ncbi:MAG TPA: hypothetical protein VGH56_02690 [Solirubrobacteraceae bacterium]